MWEIGLLPLRMLEAPDQIVILRRASGIRRRIVTITLADGAVLGPGDAAPPRPLGSSQRR
jgi:hypothetical protein